MDGGVEDPGTGGGRRDPRSPAERDGAGELSTVGTGSMVAIGCVLGAMLLVLAGLAFLILVRTM